MRWGDVEEGAIGLGCPLGFRQGSIALGIETGDVGADSRKIGLELGHDLSSVLGEDRLWKVGDRHFGRPAANHLWLCESCGARETAHNDRGQI